MRLQFLQISELIFCLSTGKQETKANSQKNSGLRLNVFQTFSRDIRELLDVSFFVSQTEIFFFFTYSDCHGTILIAN